MEGLAENNSRGNEKMGCPIALSSAVMRHAKWMWWKLRRRKKRRRWQNKSANQRREQFARWERDGIENKEIAFVFSFPPFDGESIPCYGKGTEWPQSYAIEAIETIKSAKRKWNENKSWEVIAKEKIKKKGHRSTQFWESDRDTKTVLYNFMFPNKKCISFLCILFHRRVSTANTRNWYEYKINVWFCFYSVAVFLCVMWDIVCNWSTTVFPYTLPAHFSFLEMKTSEWENKLVCTITTEKIF